MPRSLLLAIAAGALSALFFVSVGLGSIGTIILLYISLLPLFAIGLHAGFMASAIACGLATVLIAVALSPAAGGYFLIAFAMPVVILTNRALLSRTDSDGNVEWYPPGYLLAILCGLALTGLAVAALVASGRDGGLFGAAREVLNQLTGEMAVNDTNRELLETARERIARYLPAMVLTSWQIMVIINGLLAQGVLSRFGANMRPGVPFSEIWLPPWLSILLPAALLGAFLPGDMGLWFTNAAIVAVLPFVFLGLSVIHAISSRWPARMFFLICVYFGLFVVGWPAAIIAAIGVLEPWIRLRQRFAGARDESEDEER